MWMEEITTADHELSVDVTVSSDATYYVVSDTVDKPEAFVINFGVDLGETNDLGFRLRIDGVTVSQTWSTDGTINSYTVPKSAEERKIEFEIFVNNYVNDDTVKFKFGPLEDSTPGLLINEQFRNGTYDQYWSGSIPASIVNESLVLYYEADGGSAYSAGISKSVPPTASDEVYIYLNGTGQWPRLKIYSTDGSELEFISLLDVEGGVAALLTDIVSNSGTYGYSNGTLGDYINKISLFIESVPF